MALVILTLGDADKANQEILQLLDTVFTSDLNTEQISTKLKDDFGLVLTPKMEQELSEMCNLSIGIEERGIEKGIALGIFEQLYKGDFDGK